VYKAEQETAINMMLVMIKIFYVRNYNIQTQDEDEDFDLHEVQNPHTFSSRPTQGFYRAMHFSAYARSWDRMSSVRPSVRPSVCLSVCL